MALSYWGWEGDQRDTAEFTKPNPRDKNVMPYEMEDYVREQTDLSAIVRVGGDLETLKALIAAGYPVIVEKSFEGPRFDGWMGHYEVVNGYDDATQTFTVQDSYDGPDLSIPYQDMLSQWQAFNYTYIVVYPGDRGPQVNSILGVHADTTFNLQHAAQVAEREANTLSGREKFFAWFNLGSSLARLHDYTAASIAFDAAFANYASIPEELRPWRMLWYQTGPYFAYYYSGRYQDVIDLATTTLDAMSEPILEESYYWRAMAEVALGDVESAIEDLRKSLQYHPDFVPSVELLRQLGEEP
jgi:tetratricopeptide (TPR) repeat protein